MQIVPQALPTFSHLRVVPEVPLVRSRFSQPQPAGFSEARFQDGV